MADIIFGAVIIVFCLVCYFLSWKFQKQGNFKRALLLLMACGLVLRIYTSCDFFLHTWDERYHALVAKNLIEHPLAPTLYDKPILPYDYKSWVGNNIWLHKQPFPLWMMATSMWMFGVNEIALRLPSIILTTIGIWLTFFIGKYFFNDKVGYLTAFFYSVNGLIIELTAGRVATDHFDIFFLFFIELAIFFSIVFAQKQKTIYNLLAGLSIGAAILAKWLPALIVLPIWLLIVFDAGNFKIKTIIFHFFVLTVTCLVIFLPWQLYIFKTFPAEASWEADFNLKHITGVLEDRTGPFYYFFDKIRINYGELIYLPLIWFLWKAIKDIRNKKRLALTIWVLIPLLFFSFAKTKMQAYILFISPALFVMTSEFFFMLNDYKKNQKLKWLFNLILFLFIVLPIRYMIERVKPFEQRDRNPKWASDLRKLNTQKISNGVLLNYSRPIEAMFYTDLISYSNLPDEKVITGLVAKGYTIIINDDGNIPKPIKMIDGVIIRKITD